MSKPNACSCVLLANETSAGGWHMRKSFRVLSDGRRIEQSPVVFARCPAYAHALGRPVVGDELGRPVRLGRPVAPEFSA